VRGLGARKLTRNLLLLVGTIALTDLGTSLFLIQDGLFLGRRPLPPFGPLTNPKQRVNLEKMTQAQVHSWIFDAGLGWTWRPSSASEDGLFQINALGARGPREYGLRPAPGKRRMATFGDSFTFCDEVSADDSFQVQLEELDPALEVLNFGVSGYGTDQALLRYERLGNGLGAEIVALGLMLENIGRNVNRYRPMWATFSGVCLTKPRFVLDPHGELVLLRQPYERREDLLAAIEDGSVLASIQEHEYWLGRPEVPTGKLSSLVRLACGYLAYRARTPSRLWQDVEGEPFQVTLAILERFQQEALRDGARLAPVLLFPARDDLEKALAGEPYWGALLAELERRGIASIDLIRPLTARARELGSTEELYAGGHLSRAGNAVVAGELLAWIRAHSP